MIRAVIHASEILTGRGIREKDGRRIVEDDLGRIHDGAIVHDGKKILWVGETRKLPKQFRKVRRLDLKKKQAVIPGLIDCHTHLIFAGDRSDEFARRCAGATYEEIATSGGGIVASVSATRKASHAQLLGLAVERVKKAKSFGVRTLELKSGYGLDFKTELKILEVARALRKKFPEMTFSTTFLGAHAFPSGVSRNEYLLELEEKMLPEVAKRKLADSCDVFVDEGYFTLSEARSLLKKAQSLRMQVRIHADELGNTESASLAAELGCLSADHLLKVSERGVNALAQSQTVAVLLPGTAFYLKAQHAPARKLLDSGVRVALATDFNPGTCMTLNLPSIMTIAALYLGMSRAEIFSAVTYNAARALALQSRKGSLLEGMDADFSILPVARFEELYYRFAW